MSKSRVRINFGDRKPAGADTPPSRVRINPRDTAPKPESRVRINLHGNRR